MNSTGQPTIVVGVSGSSSSAAALRWAADEAQRRRALLRVVRSWDPGFRAPYATLSGLPTADEQRASARQGLAAAMRATFGPATPDGVVAELAEGIAERTLIERSAAADLLVLGATSPSTPVGHPVGAVVRTCLSGAHCPVVVVGTDQGSGSDFQPGGPRPALRSLPGDAAAQRRAAGPLAGGAVGPIQREDEARQREDEAQQREDEARQRPSRSRPGRPALAVARARRSAD